MHTLRSSKEYQSTTDYKPCNKYLFVAFSSANEDFERHAPISQSIAERLGSIHGVEDEFVDLVVNGEPDLARYISLENNRITLDYPRTLLMAILLVMFSFK